MGKSSRFFFETVEAEVIFSSFVKPNETMTIYKCQKSRMTFGLSAMVAFSGLPAACILN